MPAVCICGRHSKNCTAVYKSSGKECGIRFIGVQHSLQECKGVWWMPRLKRAMKDVEWLRKVSARCQSTFDPEISEWGNPPAYGRNRCKSECTQGSKTFQYLEEKKAKNGTFFLTKTSSLRT